MNISIASFRNLSFSVLFMLPGYAATQNIHVANAVATGMMVQLTGNGLTTSGANGQLGAPSGTFINNNVVSFPYANGIILTTGMNLLDSLINKPASHWWSSTSALPGDSMLNILSAPEVTFDAQFLEFDFIAVGDSVQIEVMFASEEYNEQITYPTSDLFAIFVSGPGYASDSNIANIPGTLLPVSILTLNNGQSFGTATGPCMNCAYYIDNVGTGAVDLVYDGYSTPLVFKFPVMACSSYHIKIAIADVFDYISNSAIFLKGGGFTVTSQIPVLHHGSPSADTLYLCQGGNIILTAPPSINYNWSNGEITQSISVTQPGLFQYYVANAGCFAFSTGVWVLPGGSIQTPVIVQNINVLSAPALTISTSMTFQWNLNGIPISGATQSTYQVPVNGCYTLTIFEDSCESTSNEICITNTSIYEIATSSINIYPNPVTGTSTIETPFEAGSFSTLVLYDISGREVQRISQQPGMTAIQFDRGELLDGIYFLRISNNHYQGSITRKIVLQ